MTVPQPGSGNNRGQSNVSISFIVISVIIYVIYMSDIINIQAPVRANVESSRARFHVS